MLTLKTVSLDLLKGLPDWRPRDRNTHLVGPLQVAILQMHPVPEMTQGLLPFLHVYFPSNATGDLPLAKLQTSYNVVMKT
jgi:hypothetical protein